MSIMYKKMYCYSRYIVDMIYIQVSFLFVLMTIIILSLSALVDIFRVKTQS